MALKRVLDATKADIRSTTGKNLRITRMKNVTDNEYKLIPPNENWRLPMINELMEMRINKDSPILS